MSLHFPNNAQKFQRYIPIHSNGQQRCIRTNFFLILVVTVSFIAEHGQRIHASARNLVLKPLVRLRGGGAKQNTTSYEQGQTSNMGSHGLTQITKKRLRPTELHNSSSSLPSVDPGINLVPTAKKDANGEIYFEVPVMQRALYACYMFVTVYQCAFLRGF